MYSREIGDTTYTFEPSGGLLNASLVMQDRETDSYWSIMTDEALHGTAKGARLRQIPGSVKTTWGAWKKRHPNTRVLSVSGAEHDSASPYDRYFASEEGFRKLAARDNRLPDKALLFGFHRDGGAHAVPFPTFEKGGATVNVAGRTLFLYREKSDVFYRSTAAFAAPDGVTFVRRDGAWQVVRGDTTVALFDTTTRTFVGEAVPEAFTGFDTYWYIWSLTNPKTEIHR